MLKHYLEQRMRRSGENTDWVDHALEGAAAIYGAGVGHHNRKYRRMQAVKKLPVPVISIGNIAVGGTGKTPVTRAISNLLTENGFRVGIVSRGYRGTRETLGAMVSDGNTILTDAAASGDEAWLLARTTRAAVFVGADRFRMGSLAVKTQGVDVILLDDGFQHRRLHRDLDLVLLDWKQPFGNGHLLPRGPLREPCNALKRADAILFTRCDGGGGGVSVPLPCFRSCHLPAGYPDFEDAGIPPAGSRVVAVAGLAANAPFFSGLREKGCDVAACLGYGDHHIYTKKDMRQIVKLVRQKKADAIVTTAKDAVKLPDPTLWPVPFYVSDIRITFHPEENFSSWLLERVRSLVAVKGGENVS